MRTKALLCAAAFAASVLPSLADNVYSLNVVGYYNVTIPGVTTPGEALNLHAKLIANQLQAADNSLNTVLPYPSVPVNSVLQKYVPGLGFYPYTMDEFDSVWYPDDAGKTLKVGEAALFVNADAQTTPLTLTFVGEVAQGWQTNNIPAGYSTFALPTPQTWAPDDVNGNNYAFPSRVNDTMSKYVTGVGFFPYTYDEFDSVWYPADPAPTIAVGEGVLVFKAAPDAFIRNFTVDAAPINISGPQ